MNGHVIDSVGRRIKITDDPATTAPLHAWDDPDGDGHNCTGCPPQSIWRCDQKAHDNRYGHNHFTRDIKAPGKCPACDDYTTTHPAAHTLHDTEESKP